MGTTVQCSSWHVTQTLTPTLTPSTLVGPIATTVAGTGTVVLLSQSPKSRLRSNLKLLHHQIWKTISKKQFGTGTLEERMMSGTSVVSTAGASVSDVISICPNVN